MTQYFGVVFNVVKDLVIRQKAGVRPRFAGLACLLKGAGWNAALVVLAITATLLGDFHITPFGEGIYNGYADTMQPAGDFVSFAAELCPGVQHSHRHFYAGDPHLGVFVNRYAVPVVANGDAVVLVQRHIYLVAPISQHLVDTVVHDLNK